MRRSSLIPFAVVMVAFAGLAAYCDRPIVPPPFGDSLGGAACASPINECVKGTVEFTPIEGGCWLIKADNGVSYQAVAGLDEKFRQDGLRVFLVFRPNNSTAGFCPGRFVDVVSLTVLPDGPVSPVTPIPPVTP